MAEALAAKAAARAEAAETADEEAAATHAFHRAARSARQSMALEAKLVRDHQAGERVEIEVARFREAAAAGKVGRPVRVRDRLVWTEAERATQEEGWNAFLDRVADSHSDRLSAIANDPKAYMAWMERRFEAIGADLESARAAVAAGRPLPPGPLEHYAEDPELPPDYGVKPDSS